MGTSAVLVRDARAVNAVAVNAVGALEPAGPGFVLGG